MLELKNISKKYLNGTEENIILDNISITFPDHGFIGIYGESGGGKSTLLNIISSLQVPDSGTITYNNHSLETSFLKNEVSFMYQNLDLIYSLNVKENIMISSDIKGIEYKHSYFDRIVRMLEIDHLLDYYPHQLSTGQAKRVSLARAILKDASILLCDEPTGAIHSNSAHVVMNLLKNESARRLVIIVSHDKELLDKYCDSVLRLENHQLKGKIIKNKLDKEPRGTKKHLLLYYVYKQIYKQRYKYFFLYIFMVIMIISSFLILTLLQGLEYTIQQSEIHAPLKNVMTIEHYDHSEFDNFPSINNAYYEYESLLSLGELSIDYPMYYLPNYTSHIVLESGRMPSNSKEVLVTSSLNKVIKTSTIHYYINDTDYTLKIVGVIKEDFFNEKCVYFHYGFKNEISQFYSKQIIVIESENAKELYDQLEEDYLVTYDVYERSLSYKSLLTIGRIVLFIFFGISVICSLFLLYIVYSTIMNERHYDHSILMMMGLSFKRLFFLCLIEAMLFGLLVGLSGCLMSAIIYYYLNHVYHFYNIYHFSLRLHSYFLSKFDLFVFIIIFYVLLSVGSISLLLKKLRRLDIVSVLREE